MSPIVAYILFLFSLIVFGSYEAVLYSKQDYSKDFKLNPHLFSFACRFIVALSLTLGIDITTGKDFETTLFIMLMFGFVNYFPHTGAYLTVRGLIDNNVNSTPKFGKNYWILGYPSNTGYHDPSFITDSIRKFFTLVFSEPTVLVRIIYFMFGSAFFIFG